jgi:N-methylhydantoinase A
VPNVASVLSAWGMLQSNLRYEISQTFLNAGGKMTSASLRTMFTDMEDRARSEIQG